MVVRTLIRVYERNRGWQYGYHYPISRFEERRSLRVGVVVIELIDESVKKIYCMWKYSEKKGGLEKQFESV